jgi:hypothetical protein
VLVLDYAYVDQLQRENDMRSKSSRKTGHQILGVLSAKRAERLLDDFANEDPAGEFRSLSQYQDILPTSPDFIAALRQVQPLLRKAWDAPDLWRFEWYSWAAEMVFHQRAITYPAIVERLKTVDLVPIEAAESATLIHLDIGRPPDTPSPMHAVFFHFRHSRARALYCPNSSCKSRYFFATKKGQKYCSTVCALPSQRESKRLWWQKNLGGGKKRRKAS